MTRFRALPAAIMVPLLALAAAANPAVANPAAANPAAANPAVANPAVPAAAAPAGSVEAAANLAADVPAAGSVAAGSVAARSVAAGSVAARSVAAGSVAARSVAAGSVAARSVAVGSAAADRAALAAYPNPGYVAGDTGIHDPAMVKTPAGGYLAAYTGANIQLKTSADRTTFRNAGAVFPGGASWTTAYTGGSNQLWAPDLSYRNGRYYLYYSASTFGSNRSAIFLATSTTGASGSWTNQGLVIETSSSNDYNAIDPNLFVDPQGRWWLTFGSFWSGIKMVALNPSTGKRSDTTVRSLAGRGGGAIEAPYLTQRGSYYYLWVSFDLCCRGASSTYRVMVGRSTSVTGPFVDRNGVAMTAGGGTEMLASHGSIHGPGHQAVFTDTDADVLVYHYYADSGASYLGINLIGYDSAGWPYVY